MKAFLRRTFEWLIHGVPQKIIYAKITEVVNQDRLSNKNVIVTGGGRGLGFYIAKKIYLNGGKVLITGRNEDILKKASEQLNNCPYMVFDVQHFDLYDDFFQNAEHALGGEINCLVNNAGISLHEKSIFEVTLDTFDVQFNTNIKAPYFLTKSFLKYTQQKGIELANVVFITSERGLYGDSIPYGLTKSAINSLTMGLARRYITKGIKINAVAPGVTASDMTRISKDGNLFRDNSCGKRVFVPEEVAETVSFILSDESNCISGHIIPCNQGNHLRSDY